jgi:ABC-type phosphate transport system substrate-binding protein
MRLAERIILGTLRTAVILALLFGERAGAELVVIVSAKSPLTTLTKSQIADIFLGKTNHLPDGQPATPIDQPEGSASRDEFNAKFVGKSAAQIKNQWAKIIFTGRGFPPKEAANGVEVKKLVAQDPNAIGYIDPGLLDPSVKVLQMQ